jgi:hypothetical protein
MQVFPFTVYLLCLATSLLCTFLLFRSYRRSRVKLLLWTALCFVALALNNLFLTIDFITAAEVNLQPLRHLASLGAVLVLLYGFIWESD